MMEMDIVDARAPEATFPPAPSPGGGRRELVVDRDGSSYELDGRRVSLERKRNLRLILVALAEQAERRPGLGLSQAELLSFGWPGEKMTADSGALRVYTSVRRLRRDGLASALVTRGNRYMLEPTLRVRRR